MFKEKNQITLGLKRQVIPSYEPLTVSLFLFQPGFSSKYLSILKRLAWLLQDDSKQASNQDSHKRTLLVWVANSKEKLTL